MKRIIRLLVLICLVFITSSSFVPSGKLIHGKVISFSESFPLEGVTIQVKGTKNITGTQADGTFSLELKPDDQLLIFSLQGYQTQEIKVSPGQQEYDVILKSL